MESDVCFSLADHGFGAISKNSGQFPGREDCLFRSEASHWHGFHLDSSSILRSFLCKVWGLSRGSRFWHIVRNHFSSEFGTAFAPPSELGRPPSGAPGPRLRLRRPPRAPHAVAASWPGSGPSQRYRKSSSEIPPTSCFSRIVVTVFQFFRVSICILESVCLCIYKKPCWDFDWNCVKSVSQFGGESPLYYVDFFSPWTWHGSHRFHVISIKVFFFFFLDIFKISCLHLAFSSLVTMCLTVDFCVFILLGICWASWICKLLLFLSLSWSSGLFLRAPVLCPLLWDPLMLDITPTLPRIGSLRFH